MLKIGVVGAGHLGKIHVKLIKELSDQFEFVGFHDHHSENAIKVSEEFGIRAFDSLDELLNEFPLGEVFRERRVRAFHREPHLFPASLEMGVEIGHRLLRADPRHRLPRQIDQKRRVGMQQTAAFKMARGRKNKERQGLLGGVGGLEFSD